MKCDDDKTVAAGREDVTIPLSAGGRGPEDGVDLAAGGKASGARGLLSRDHGRKYRVNGVVARGGMGMILDARDLNVRRSVAMKVLLQPGQATEEQVVRFIEEAQVTGQLQHPNIVPLYELGLGTDGNVFYTMKYVEGVTLKDILAKKKDGDRETLETYTLAQLLGVFQRICNAVAFAHSKGVVHRDLKSANVMVGEYGEVLVMDWGLAKVIPGTDKPKPEGIDPGPNRETTVSREAIDSVRKDPGTDVFKTMDGIVVGTPHFMAPEQAVGEHDKIDERTDIYSLGAILYEILTLERPVEGDKAREILKKLVSGNAVRRPELRAPGLHIPREMSAVAMKCLSHDPGDRYPTVLDLRRDVDRYLEGRGVSAAPDTLAQGLVKLVRRNRAASTAVAASALILVVLTATFLVRLKSQRDVAIASEGRAIVARQAAEIAEGRARALLVELEDERERLIQENYAANISLAAGKIRDRTLKAAGALLERTPTELRHWEWGRLMRQLEPEALCFKMQSRAWEAGLQATADMRWLAIDVGTKAEVWDLSEVRLVRTIDDCTALHLFPSGDDVLVARDREVVREKTGTGEELARWPQRPAKVTALALQSDGKMALVGGQDGSAELVRVADGATAGILPGGKRAVTAVSFSRDHKRALVREKTAAAVLNLATGEKLFATGGFFQNPASVALSPDGTRLLTAHYDKRAVLWDVDSGRQIREIKGHRGIVRAVAFDRDGERVFSAGVFGVLCWSVANGRQLWSAGPNDDIVFGMAVGPDPRWVVTGHQSGSVRVWDMEREADVPVLRPGSPSGGYNCCQVAVSHDGDTALSTGWERNSVAVLDIRQGTVRRRLATKTPSEWAAITSDGRWGITVGHGQSAALWDLETGVAKGHVWHADGGARCVAIHPDEDRFVTGREGKIKVWSLPGCQLLGDLDVDMGGMAFAEFSSDGAVLLLRSLKKTLALDMQERRTRASLEVRGSNPAGAAFLPDDRRVLLGSQSGPVVLWDTLTGDVLRRYPVVGTPSVAVSPDGRRGFFGCWDQTVRVWDLESAREVMSFSPQSGGITSLAITGDGRTLLVGGCGGARDVTLHRAVDWRKTAGELRQEKLEQWRSLFR